MEETSCILSKFYIKPQLILCWYKLDFRCILSKFYIKPQHVPESKAFTCVVSYRNSTSNHNILTLRSVSITLYLIEILHQTTTAALFFGAFGCCILSKFYIKPQRRRLVRWPQGVVSYRNSTSNHNHRKQVLPSPSLYLIEILHQTTTGNG